MVDILILTTLILSFLLTLVLTGWWIKNAQKMKYLVFPDMNKFEKPKVIGAGGVCVLIGVVFAIFFYIGVETYIFKSTANLVDILAIVCTLLIIGMIGFVDDVLGWRVGSRQIWKPLMTLPAAIPLMVINVGKSSMNIPFLGAVDFGLIYPLILVPAAIIGTSNGFNMLAGHNGLEAGLGVIILSFMGYVAWVCGLGWLALIAFVMVVALLAFLVFNWYPAKVFPGNTLTYSVGALIGIVAVMGNMEKIAIILFIPFFIELILKAKHRFKTENFCVPNKEDMLSLPNGKIYSVCHLSLALILLSINKRFATERNLVIMIYFMEILLIFTCIFAFPDLFFR